MSYEATVRGFDLQVMDREGMMEYLNQVLKQYRLTEYPCEDLEQALEHFLWAGSIVIDSNDSFGELSICDIKYHEEDWQSIAPFLSGYIEWIGEDDAVWRDYFRDGKIESEYPEIIWPSEHSYTESSRLEVLMVKHGAVIRALPECIRSVYDKRHADQFPNAKVEFLPEYNREMLVDYERPTHGGQFVLETVKNNCAMVRFSGQRFFDSLEEVVEYLACYEDNS